MIKTCIFSAALHLDAKDLAIFCNSIRRNGYQGDVVMVGNGLTGDADKLFSQNDIQFRVGEELQTHLDRGRWGWYIPHISDYDFVFGCDSRDVVIQGDLADFWQDGLHVTEEAANVGDEETNTHYITVAHGQAVFERAKNMRAINGGTVWGDSVSMLAYCQEQMKGYRGTDQGVLIGLVREGILKATIHPNREQIWTLALEGFRGRALPQLPLDYQFVDGKMATPEGHVPNVIHQYNRFLELVGLFTELYGA